MVRLRAAYRCLALAIALASLLAPHGDAAQVAASRPAIPSVGRAERATATTHAGGGLRPVRQLAVLLDQATTVVRGTVQSVSEDGEALLAVARDPHGFAAPRELTPLPGESSQVPDSYPVTVLKATIAVTEVVKGDGPAPGSSLTVNLYRPHTGPRWQSLAAGQHGLLLLDAQGALSDLYYPFLLISPQAPGAQGVSPAQAVTQLLSLSIRPDAPPAVLLSCVEGLLDLGSADRAASSLRSLAASPDPALAGIGLWGLVALKDEQAVPAAVAYVLQREGHDDLPVPPALLGTVLRKLDAPDLADAVRPLLSSSEAGTRRIALDALRRMKNPAAIPLFVARFADTDEQNRYVAMMSVSEITGIAPTDISPTLPTFSENLQVYLEWWTEWWEREGKAKYGATG